jgi:hypothetical protein
MQWVYESLIISVFVTIVFLVIVGVPLNRMRGSPSEGVYVMFCPKLCIISNSLTTVVGSV